ncbi:hypothetical protein [Paenibacillus alvei]|uniref:Secreted protein n=1 Tax=Paenibacillus alvei TaxID=44250 RepID=A0AAP7A1Y4_PAEAL|nr:hypothetical protein [Paenibacillus alvei]MBG9736217.1 hypothetical protein [Paenibacillus alvei]MBG9745916.1 hypothetical protein [Paenibacillus alvei]MCY9582681.1 hypothetical protein [Paenibacillus alvei]MCY9587973.1 hypothetical protein [Paenibacillus alvei]NOJ72327.1 hypothetical protein [Paenibacillus alvei]
MRKFASTLLVFALMLSFSSNAFAAKGVGDNHESAITLFPKNTVNLYVEDSTDKDWFTWTNNTGKMQKFTAWAHPKDDWKNFRLAFQIEYSDNTKTRLLYANYNIGPLQSIDNIYIPNGAKLYLLIEKVNNSMSQYSLNFDVNDI